MADRSAVMSRDAATRKVMKTIGQREETLPLVLDDGTSPLVIAMPYEHVSEVINRVASLGGQANVAVAFAQSYATLIMARTTEYTGEYLVINQDLSMGMFLISVKNHPGQKIRFQFRDVDSNVPEISQELAYA